MPVHSRILADLLERLPGWEAFMRETLPSVEARELIMLGRAMVRDVAAQRERDAAEAMKALVGLRR